MKTKKLLNSMMAFGLVLSAMCVNVSAAHQVTELEIEKTVKLEDGNLAPQETFEFTMVPSVLGEGTKLDHLEIKPGVDLGDKETVNIQYITSDDATELTKKVKFDLSGLVFDKEAAIYRYEVKETAGTTAAMTYDGTSYIVDIYVTNEGDIYQVLCKDSTAENKAPIKFENNYATETLEVNKTVEGIFSDKNKDFTFRVTLNEMPTIPAGTQLTATKTNSDGTTEEITFVVGEENVFTLAHGEKLTVNNLPEGMEYEVTEDAVEGYTTTSTDSDNGHMDDNGATVAFVNTSVDNVTTGISLSVLPYILSLAGAVSGFAVLTVLKRKKEEA